MSLYKLGLIEILRIKSIVNSFQRKIINLVILRYKDDFEKGDFL